MTTENTVSSILITGTADNDSVLNFGDDVTIDSGSGNDTIYSGLDDQKADRVSINAGEGDNIVSVQGGSDSVTVRTGDGNNMIVTTCPNNAVFSGAGKDSVTFYTGSDNNTVDSGDGDDVIDAVGHNVTINAGAGNDRIRTYRNAYDISIKAGTGDDDITLGGPVDTDHTNVVQYADGDGNDTISTFSATDTLQITSGNISGAELVGNNVVITVGSGTITLVEANNMNINILDADGKLNQTIFSGGSSEDTIVNDTLISGTDGDDYLINDSGKNVTISALNGNDTIENTGDSSIIDAGEGDNMVSVAGAAFVAVTTGDGSNTIYSDSNGASGRFRFGDGNNSIITSNRYSTIIGGSGGNGITLHNGSFSSYVEAGSGDDTVAVGHYDITVDGGTGNDLINLYRDAENSLIIMGTGNDTVTVYNNKHAQTFQYSGGNDLITGFDANDTLRIAGFTSSSSIVSGDNIILDFGDSTITLAGVSSAESLNVEYLGKWTTIDGGFVYSGHTTNNYTVTADVSLVGADLKDEDGDGAPDNVTVGVFKSNVLGVAAVVRGLSGEITLNNKAVGVIGDDNYEDHFVAKVRDGAPDSIVAFGEMRELRGISDGATVNATAKDMIAFDENAKVHLSDVENVSLNNKNYMIDGSAHAQIGISNNGAGADLIIEDGILTGISGLEDGFSISLVPSNNVSNELIFQTDGGTGEIVIGGETLSIGGESNFTVELDDDSNIIKNKWATIDGGFVYSGHATNNYAKTADVSLIGAALKDEDGDGAPDNITVSAYNYSSVTGVMAVMEGLSGEITLNNKAVGVIGDDNYEDHFTAKVIDNASAAVKAYAETKEVRGISDGATVNPNSNDIVGFDENAKAHVGDVTKFFIYNKNRKVGGSAHAQIGISNSGAGADLTIEDDILTEVSGLEDGYSFSLTSSDNVSSELKFNDVGSGSLEVTSGIDDTFKIDFSDTSKAQSITGSGSSIELIGSSGDDLLITGATNSTLTGGAGNDTFGGSAGLSSCVITDYTEGEDVIYHGRPFADLSVNGSIEGNDYVFRAGSKTTTVKDGADKVIKSVDVNGETRYFGKYLTLDDNDPATVTAQDGVATIDAVLRTEDIVVNGSSDDNTIISSSGNCTLYGGEGNDTFVRGSRTAEQTITVADFTEDEDEVYHSRPFADFSLLEVAKSVGDDYVFEAGTATIEYIGGANKKIKFVDVNGDVAYFGNYITIFDVDSDTVEATEKVKVLDATARTKDIQLIGNALDNTIISSSGNCTLYGGEGKDTFVRGSSSENQTIVVADYTEDEDEVYHNTTFGEISFLAVAEADGDDYVFKVGSAMSRYIGGANKKLKFVDVNGDVAYFGNYITIFDVDSDTVEATEKVKVLDASARTEDIQLIGNALDNTIISGTGNDTLTGGSGSDLFVYSAGNNVITDYATDDKISIGAAVSGATVDGADIVITTDGGALTVQNAKGKTLSLIDSAGETVSTLIGGGSPAQVISDLTGIDVDNLEEISVTNADELAALKEAETSLLEISGNQNVDLSKFDNAQIVSLGNGRQSVKFNDKDDNIAVVDENARGQKNIVFGKGNDLGIFNSENANVRVDLSKASNTTIAPYAGSVTLEGYKDASILIPNVEDIVGAVMESAIEFDSDKIKIGSVTVKFDSAADSRLINLVTEDSDEQKVAFVKGGTLNLGNNRGNYLIKGEADSTITAGAGNDTILADDENKIDAGAGSNEIYLGGDGNSTIVMRNGKATVENFKAGFEDGDRLFFGVNDTIDFKFDGNDVKVYNNGSLRGILSNVADGADFVNILTADDNSAPKVVVAQKGAVITVEDEVADLYFGNKSGVDFSNYAESVNINLGAESDSVGGGEVLFSGVNQITLGSGLNTVSGSSRNETLTGNADGITEFNFRAGGGRDVINNFNFDEDKINVGNETITAVNVNNSGGVRMEISGSATLTLEDAQGKNFKVNNFVALVDKNITYNAEANYFVATSRNATLTVSDDVEGDAVIWLDNPARNGSVFKGDIKTLDASGAIVKTELAGNDLDNTILAGLGDASLWGGNGGNDLLQGGAGKNIFFYLQGNGNDTIAGANDGDEIILSGVTLEQIAGTNITADGVAIDFKDGGALQVNSAADVSYQLADGTKFSANHESLSWETR